MCYQWGVATWSAGRLSGWVIAILSAVAWFVGNLALSRTFDHPITHVWNAAMPAFIYGVVVHLLSALHRVQAELEERVERRTVSLAEVHHRVKNNLQVISGLLMLQAVKLTDPADKAVFGECRDRIHSMARLHEQLYSRGDYENLDFASHLQELAQMLVYSHTPKGCALELKFQADPVVVDLDTAVTLGLIANELLLNALKHGFRGRDAGTLTVELHGGAMNRMIVRDSGSGLPPDFDPSKDGKLGIELILGMTRQIHGQATIENDPAGGACVTVSFPAAPPAQREQANQTNIRRK